ncbi:MAG: hypothetical protein ACWA5Q_08055 [bacterium]
MKPNHTFIVICLALTLLAACVDQNTVTPKQIEMQNKADAVVSSLLFERGLDDHASYNIRKDGTVVIKFDRSVFDSTYTQVVAELRGHPDINTVYAEQMGKEVCPLTRP